MKKNVLLGVAVLLLCVITAKAQTFVLQVDMSYVVAGQVSATTFNPATDTIDVAGSLNGWGETVIDLTRVGDSYVYEVALDLDSANFLIEYKFRINHSWDGDRHDQLPSNRRFTVRENGDVMYADTVKSIFSDTREDYEQMTFKVNMAKQIADGNFDAETEFVDIAGTFNDWGGYNELAPAGSAGMYSGYVLAPIGDVEWKTRINANWNNSEAIDNRQFAVVAGIANGVEYWYGNDTLAIPSDSLPEDSIPSLVGEDLFASVSAYPNPFANSITVSNLENVNHISVANVIGQQVMVVNVANQEAVEINTADMETGIYFIMVTNNNGERKALRVVKQ